MTGFPNDQLSKVFMGAAFNNVSGFESRARALGFVFTGSYMFQQRYAVDFNVRVDASSRFGEHNRFAPFWSTGARWNAHNEGFFRERLGFFEQFVIRGSIGLTGSQDFDAWQARRTYTYHGMMTHYTSANVVGAVLMAMGNPYLKWQNTMNHNLALDVTMFNGTFNARVEAYNRLTRNTLLDYTLPPSMGFASVRENVGEISNRGYEFSMLVTPFRDPVRRAFWNVQVTGARNRSTIERISNALENRNRELFADGANDLTRPVAQFVTGVSPAAIWGMQSVGIDPQTGLEVFRTRGGDLTTEWHHRNIVIIGNTEPVLRGRVNSTFSFRDFTVTFSGAYSLGGDVYNQTLADRVENANLRYNVDRRVLTERWLYPGDVARFTRIYGAMDRPHTRTTSRFVMRENLFTLAAINATYRMSAHDFDFIRQMGVSHVTMGVFTEDILRFSTVQMERGIMFPFARTISFSLNVAF
jgi:hypothetical protein